MEREQVIRSVQRWLEEFVIGMNLCPFARAPLQDGTIRFAVVQGNTVEHLLHHLARELARLGTDPNIATTLLIHPAVLEDFYEYNQFLTTAENLLTELGYAGVYQVASFHPQYQFAGTAADDAENYSNRSPYPMLHLLREEMLATAIASHPDTEAIPQRNIARLNGLGAPRLRQLLALCLDPAGR